MLRGCPVGRLTMDPDVIANHELRAPVEETLDWLRGRLAGIVQEGLERGELSAALDPAETAATIVATVQGGYVLARASRLGRPPSTAARRRTARAAHPCVTADA